MRKAIVGGLALVVVALLAWASSDPWKSKPYDQWDAKDVQKVMNGSPWARTVTVDANWMSGGALSQPESSRAPQSAPSGGMGSGGGRGGMGGGGGAPAGGGGGQSVPEGSVAQASFIVRWVSSRVMREAFVRNLILNGQMKADEGQKELAQTPDTYQVMIVGPQMQPFESVEEAAVKDAAFLEPKKTKERIAASKVEFQRSSDGKTLRAVVISFPKRTATSEATITPEEKGTEFSVLVGKTTIKASFDFTKMYDSTGRDL
ncbi:MAG TPA: hypothetical protein VEJ67_15870 [Candidatus Cybelea sp.]|nr:hypothetical protein [Candidatus Cybelea sp.]